MHLYVINCLNCLFAIHCVHSLQRRPRVVSPSPEMQHCKAPVSESQSITCAPCLRKKCAKLFFLELFQILINFNNSWQIDEKMANIIFYINIFHLASLMSLQYLVKQN